MQLPAEGHRCAIGSVHHTFPVSVPAHAMCATLTARLLVVSSEGMRLEFVPPAEWQTDFMLGWTTEQARP